jgi:hypothetical protein
VTFERSLEDIDKLGQAKVYLFSFLSMFLDTCAGWRLWNVGIIKQPPISLFPKEITVYSGIVWRDKIYGDRRQICERALNRTVNWNINSRNFERLRTVMPSQRKIVAHYKRFEVCWVFSPYRDWRLWCISWKMNDSYRPYLVLCGWWKGIYVSSQPTFQCCSDL